MGLWDEFERHGSAVKSLDILSQSAVSGSLALPLAGVPGLQGARELSFLTHHPVWHTCLVTGVHFAGSLPLPSAALYCNHWGGLGKSSELTAG